MSKNNLGLSLVMAGCLLVAAVFPGASIAQSAVAESVKAESQQADVEVFVREGCPHCAKAEEFLAKLQLEKPRLKVIIRDVSQDPAALERLKQIAERLNVKSARVPAFAVGGQLILGFTDELTSGRLIRDALAQQGQAAAPALDNAASCEAEDSLACGPDAGLPAAAQNALPAAAGGVKETNPLPAEEGRVGAESNTFQINFLGQILTLDQVGLPLFTVAMGLMDGFNPCSMWVLLLMISLLAPMNNRGRMLAVAGTFIAVEGIAYFVFMAAWLNLFLLIGLSRASELIIAAIAILAGAINLKDFWAFGWGVSLSIPNAAKPGIYARIRAILQAKNLVGAITGAVVLAVLVQIVEFLCTSGFPALFTRILTLKQPDGFGYYAYLLLYNLAYMLDDIIVLSIGVITLSQRRLQEKEGRWLKLGSGLVMVGLGIYLAL